MFQNPVLRGFYPDPSVCRVGQDYYLVTSTFEYFPGVPIFHSTDLVNWEQIGFCLTRKSQLDLDGIPASRGIFAPTIRFHDGVFYMITTNVGKGGNFYVTATDPAGPWSDPVFVDEELFDPSLFFDDDGRIYYTRRGNPGIVQAEIDIATGRLKADPVMICDRFISPDIEGPHLYRIHGMYYLLAAEGGSRFGHAEVIGRSESPWGPFEPCPHNPIMTHRHHGHGPIRDVGHAELVDDPQGSWWLFCLGTRHVAYNSASVLGRETFLMPVTWTDDLWPVVGDSGAVAPVVHTDLLPAAQRDRALWRDDFDRERLDFTWQFLRNPAAEDWSLQDRPGCLRLNGSAVSLDDLDSPAFVGRRQQDFKMAASCAVAFQPTASNEEAGLTVFYNWAHHYDLMVTVREDARRVVLRKRVGDMTQEVASEPVDAASVLLRVSSDGVRYAFTYVAGDRVQCELGTGLMRLMCPEVAHENSAWTGVFIGLFASGNGAGCQNPADFDWFEYRPM